MAFIPLTKDQWVFCQILYKVNNDKLNKLCELVEKATICMAFSYSLQSFGSPPSDHYLKRNPEIPN